MAPLRSRQRCITYIPTGNRKVFIYNLNPMSKPSTLTKYFCQFGNVEHIYVPRDLTNPRYHLKGYGFVRFAQMEGVKKVLEQPVHIIDSREVDVSHTILRDGIRKLSLFVGGIKPSASPPDVANFFSQFEGIESVMIPTDQNTWQHIGFVFATFRLTKNQQLPKQLLQDSCTGSEVSETPAAKNDACVNQQHILQSYNNKSETPQVYTVRESKYKLHPKLFHYRLAPYSHTGGKKLELWYP